LIGREVEVLVEGRSERNAARLFGRTGSNKGVVFEGPDRLRGELLNVRVERASAITLVANPVVHDS
jgi:tRNA-2-methylthio-N6-dimethylallyladenosine synthase